MRANLFALSLASAALLTLAQRAAAQEPIYCHGCMHRAQVFDRDAFAERMQRQSERIGEQAARRAEAAERLSTRISERVASRMAAVAREREWDRVRYSNDWSTSDWQRQDRAIRRQEQDRERARARAERDRERARDRPERARDRARRDRWYR